MKKCSKCGVAKDFSEYYKDKRAKDGLTSECKSCHYASSKLYKQRTKDKQREYVKKSRGKKKDLLYTYKTPCVKCGETRLYIVDFHHIDHRNKSFGISTKYANKSEVLLPEIQKCVCLCKNCHYEYHYLYGRTPSEPVESLTEYLGRNPYAI